MNYKKAAAAINISALLFVSFISAPPSFAEGSNAFDRNGDGIHDLNFINPNESLRTVFYENQPDAGTKYGVVDLNGDGTLDAIWFDRNDNAIVEERELKRLKIEMPWEPLRQLDSLDMTLEEDSPSIFLDYTGDDFLDESLIDENGDGYIEKQTLHYEQDDDGSYSLSFEDRDGDLFLDTIYQVAPGRGGALRQFVFNIPDWAEIPSLQIVTQDDEPAYEESAPLFGFWGLNGYHSVEGLTDVQNRFGTNVFQVASSNPTWTVNTLLPMVEAAGMKVTLRMTGDHDGYTSNGDFDLEKWLDDLSAWQDVDVQQYIDNGVLLGHMLLDDVQNFEGHDPDFDEFEAMAAYSKELFPGLMTYVRCQASTMPEGNYTEVDAIVNQYNSYNQAPIEEYVTEEYEAAVARNLGIINGLNIADGGNGSSGQVGWRDDRWAMSSDEILEYGRELIQMPNMIMFLMWEYDANEFWTDGSIGSDYFDQEELQSAISQLGLEISGL